MRTIIPFLTIMLISPALAQGQVYKCRTPAGQLVISDTPCQGRSKTESIVEAEVIPEAPLMQTLEAQRQRENELELTRLRRQNEDAQRAERQAMELKSKNSGDAIRECVMDVERSAATDSVKLELIAACQMAGINQQMRQTGRSSVRECIRSVEQLSGSDQDKARATARCHGADMPLEPAASTSFRPMPRPLPIHDCSGGRCTGGAPSPQVEPEGKFIGGGKSCQQSGGRWLCN